MYCLSQLLHFAMQQLEKKPKFLRSLKISYAERALETTKILGFS